jgi:hypothetical protein
VTSLETILRRIAIDLRQEHRAFALVGGLAVSVRTEPRFTRDADLVVAVGSDADAETLVHRLRARGYRDALVVEQLATGRMATVRLGLSTELYAPVVDLLFASSGIEPEVVDAAEAIEIVRGLTVPVAATGHLIALKVLARDDVKRPQDLVDLRALLRVSTVEELDRARDALALITARGYGRGRDLDRDLAAIVDERT